MTDISYVVVGAGLAGARAVRSLREDGDERLGFDRLLPATGRRPGTR